MNETMDNLPQTACDVQQLERFLQADDFCLEDAELLKHLDTCVSCQQYLHTHAADDSTWNSAEMLLKPLTVDQSSNPFYSAAGTQSLNPVHPSATVRDVLASLAPTDDPHHLGRIGPYEVTAVIGYGAMGVVLKAIDPSLDRVVAVKVLAPRLATNEQARKRFAREAKAAAAVMHPNVIPIHSVSSDNALPYLVMAYNRGGSLQKRLQKEAPLPLAELLRIGSQIANGLSAAHEQGLVHRDIKPENILLEEGVERVMITDFGLARAVDDNTVTQHGVIAGTPMYMSPEQARGEPVDQQSDLFSLGSVLYVLCTGQPPYRDESSYGVMRRIIDDVPTPVRELNPELPDWLATIITLLMAKEKAARFATAAEVHKLLEACLSHVQQPHLIALPDIPGVSPTPERRSFLSSRKGILTMLSTTVVVALICVAFLMQQDRPSITTYGPATDTHATDANRQAVAQPSLMIESHKAEGSDGNGKELIQRWQLKGQSIGTMTVRILHIEDGKSRVVSESVYQGGTKGEQIIELEMHLKNTGDPLPFAGKALIPTLAMSVDGLQSKAQTGEKIFLSGVVGGHGNTVSGGISPEHILMYEGYHPGDIQYTKTLPSMLAASEKGAAFLVTTVDWKSTDQATNELIDDLKNIQGNWQVTHSEDNGKVAPQALLNNLQMIITKKKMSLQMAGGNMYRSTFKLDATTTPKSMDMTKNGKTIYGIYEIQGDTLRMCFAKESQPRPTSFDFDPKVPFEFFNVMERVQEKAKPMPAPEKPVKKLSDLKNGDYYLHVTEYAENPKVQFPSDAIDDQAYGPVQDIKPIRLQFLDQGKRVRIIDNAMLTFSKIPVWDRTVADGVWTYTTNKSENGMGKLILKENGNALVATFDVHGSGIPILFGCRGSLAKVTDAHQPGLEANDVKAQE